MGDYAYSANAKLQHIVANSVQNHCKTSLSMLDLTFALTYRQQALIQNYENVTSVACTQNYSQPKMGHCAFFASAKCAIFTAFSCKLLWNIATYVWSTFCLLM